MTRHKLSSFLTGFSVLCLSILKNSKYILIIYICCAIVDYLTAIFKVFANGEKFDKKLAIEGIFRKVNTFLYVFVTLAVDFILIDSQIKILEGGVTKPFVIWLIINELLSILHNIEYTKGVKRFEYLHNLIEKLRELFNDTTK